MTQYARIASGVVVELFDTADDITHLFAPQLVWVATNNDPGAVVGAAYADGVFTAPRPPVVQIPAQVSMRQARLALNAIDKLAAVDAVIAAMPEPQKTDARIEWEYSSAVQRDKPLVQQLGIALELDAAALDQLFLTAATL